MRQHDRCFVLLSVTNPSPSFTSTNHDDEPMMLPHVAAGEHHALTRALRERNYKIQRSF